MNIELPSIGRIVYFYDGKHTKPFPAIVRDTAGFAAYLTVFTSTGLKTLTDPTPIYAMESSNEPHWDWMPYQKGQAAKTEQLEIEKLKLLEELNTVTTTSRPLDEE